MSDETTVVEAVEAVDESTADQLRQVQWLSTLLDDSIRLPGGYTIGIDPLVGILPVVGDLSASAVSVYIVLEAIYLGVPRETLVRMLGNVAVDTVVGSIPVVGPVFDAVFKANARNVRLLEARVEQPQTASADRWVLGLVGALMLSLTVAASLGVGFVVWWLAGQAGVV